jgi:hypothetical protein
MIDGKQNGAEVSYSPKYWGSAGTAPCCNWRPRVASSASPQMSNCPQETPAPGRAPPLCCRPASPPRRLRSGYCAFALMPALATIRGWRHGRRTEPTTQWLSADRWAETPPARTSIRARQCTLGVQRFAPLLTPVAALISALRAHKTFGADAGVSARQSQIQETPDQRIRSLRASRRNRSCGTPVRHRVRTELVSTRTG